MIRNSKKMFRSVLAAVLTAAMIGQSVTAYAEELVAPATDSEAVIEDVETTEAAVAAEDVVLDEEAVADDVEDLEVTRVQAPVTDTPAGNYVAGMNIKLYSGTDGATIYYTMTTDGTEPADPTTASTKYDAEKGIDVKGGAETVKVVTTIKAIAYQPEKDPATSKITTLVYNVTIPSSKEVTYKTWSWKDSTSTYANLTGGTVYGDAEIATIVFGEDQKWNAAGTSEDSKIYDEDGVTGLTNSLRTDHILYKGYVQGSNNAKTGGSSGSTAKGTVADYGSYMQIEAVADSTLTIVTEGASGKAWDFVDITGSSPIIVDSGSNIETKANIFSMEAGHTYQFYGEGTKAKIYEIALSKGVNKDRAAWEDVAAPVIKSVEINKKSGDIEVTVQADISVNGADRCVVDMYDATGAIVDGGEDSSRKTSTSDVYTFTPSQSGKYSFKAYVSRDVESEYIYSEDSDEIDYTISLTTPIIVSATPKGGSDESGYSLEIALAQAVEEADYYEYTITGTKVVDDEVVTDGKVLTDVSGDDLDITSADTTVTITGIAGKNEDTVMVTCQAYKYEGDASAVGYLSGGATLSSTKYDTWAYTRYGTSVDTANNGVAKDSEKYENGKLKSVQIYSMNGKGKFVPLSTDGVTFFYNRLPADRYFTLYADLHVDEWSLSNGQDGFGVMVADRTFTDKAYNDDDGGVWNNSYQLVCSKFTYRKDETGMDTTDTNYGQYEMKLGIGWYSKTGATATDVAKIKVGALTAPENFSTDSGSLEQSGYNMYGCDKDIQGTYNIVGNRVPAHAYSSTYKVSNNIQTESSGVTDIPQRELADGESAINACLTDFKVQLKRTSDGYVLTYLSQDETSEAAYNAAVEANADAAAQYVTTESGKIYKILSQKVMYDADQNSMSLIDKDYIYVGFVVARNARMTASNIEFSDYDETDSRASSSGERDIETVKLDGQIKSLNRSSDEYYDLVFRGNADGKVTIIDANDNPCFIDQSVTAGKNASFRVKLNTGVNEVNTLKIAYTPNPDYTPSEYEVMSDYSTQNYTFDVIYNQIDGDIIYVSPTGQPDNAGTKDAPVDVFTAFGSVRAGQTIYLAGGEYMMKNISHNSLGGGLALYAQRYHDGTANSPITVMWDPDEKAACNGDLSKRPVFNFAGQSQTEAALNIVANYWYFKDFDVTNSLNGQDGIKVSGKYNTLERIRTYENGNTGIQLARFMDDSRDLWPAYNSIINCTSFNNSDGGYEDADGFAAKLTIGEGNSFTGCVAAFNADDGWDLYSKVETGSIGKVTIQNCLAFRNGFVIGVPALDAEGNETTAFSELDFFNETGKAKIIDGGNGNGFKMGGESLSGYHVLKNSTSFGNKAKGIDSNSCPDNQVSYCTSFNNLGYNVALYTNTAVNTDYLLRNVISYKSSDCNSQFAAILSAKNQSSAETNERLAPKGTQNMANIYNASSFLMTDGVSQNSNGTAFNESWFQSIDLEGFVDDFINNGGEVFRDADGVIDMDGFLQINMDRVPESAADAVSGTGAQVEDYDTADTIAEVPGAQSDAAADLSNKNIVVAADSVKTLGEVKLPESLVAAGYAFEDADADITSYAGQTASFNIVSATGKDKTVNVTFLQIKGVELVAKNDVATETAPAVFTANVITLPEEVKLTSAQSIEINSKLTITASAGTVDGKTITITKGASDASGAYKLTATLDSAFGAKASKYTATATYYVRPAAAAITYTGVTGTNVKASGDEISVKAGTEFSIDGLKAEGYSSADVTIANSDKLIVSQTSGTTFKALKTGVATLTVTSAEDKNFSRKLKVTVYDKAYTIGKGRLDIDRAKTIGVAFNLISNDPLSPASGQTVTISKVEASGKDCTELFTKCNSKVVNLSGVIYKLTVGEMDTLMADLPKVGTYTVTLKVGDMESEPFALRVNETRPLTTFAQSKPVNLFYGPGSASGNGAAFAHTTVDKATVTQLNKSECDFSLTQTSSGYDVKLTKKAEDLKADNYKVNSTMILQVVYAGYKNCYNRLTTNKENKEIVFKVKTVKKIPKIVITPVESTIYTALGQTGTNLLVYNATEGAYLSTVTVQLPRDDADKCKTDEQYLSRFEDAKSSNQSFKLKSTTDGYFLSYDTSVAVPKGGNAKLLVWDSDWNEVVLAQAKINIRTTAPAVKFVGKIALNADYAGIEDSTVTVDAQGARTYDLKNIEIEGDSTLVDNLDVEVVTNENGDLPVKEIHFSLKDTDAARSLKAGNYPITVSFDMNKVHYGVGGAGKAISTNVTITPKASVTAKASGKVNAIGRSESYVALTPKIKNVTGTPNACRLTGAAANLFEVEWDSTLGAALVYAKENAQLKTKGKYVVTPIFTVATASGNVDIVADKPVTIKVVQTNYKFKTDELALKLTAPSASDTIAFVPKTKAANVEIADVVQLDKLDNFNVEYDSEGQNITVSIKDTAGLVGNKLYQVTLKTIPKGNAIDAKVNTTKLNIYVAN